MYFTEALKKTIDDPMKYAITRSGWYGAKNPRIPLRWLYYFDGHSSNPVEYLVLYELEFDKWIPEVEGCPTATKPTCKRTANTVGWLPNFRELLADDWHVVRIIDILNMVNTHA